MTFKARTRLGPCEIVAPTGAGGMSEVYRGATRVYSPHLWLSLLVPAPATTTMNVVIGSSGYLVACHLVI
jgi:hypothetical protein